MHTWKAITQVAMLASNKHVALLSTVRQMLCIAGCSGTQCFSQFYMRDGLQAAQYAESLQKLIPQLGYLSKILPPAVLQWKLELLKQGNAVVKGMLPRIQQRVFLLTADGDLLIPSKEEGPRLQRLLPRCRLKVMLYCMQLPASGTVMWWYWHSSDSNQRKHPAWAEQCDQQITSPPEAIRTLAQGMCSLSLFYDC